MSKICILSGKKRNNGYKVSYSHIRTRKKQEAAAGAGSQVSDAVGRASGLVAALGNGKGHASSDASQSVLVRGESAGHQRGCASRRRGVVRREGLEGADAKPQGQAASSPLSLRANQVLEEGDCDAE